MSRVGLPSYELTVQNGQYPFKNAHISKIFSVQVTQQVEKNSKTLHKFLEVYHSIQSKLLITINSIENMSDSKAIIKYDYVDTPLAQYIRRFLHENIQIKLEKLYIQLRDLANQFVIKNISVLKAITSKNIGVKMVDIYRESVSVQWAKSKKTEIQMPEFRIFIDLSKCQEIQRTSNMARMVIDTDKMIYNQICKEINELVRKIEAEQYNNRKIISKMYEIPRLVETKQDNILRFTKKQTIKKQQNQICFTNKIRRRKRQKDQIKLIDFDKNLQSKSQRAIGKTSPLKKIVPSQLSSKVTDIVQKSRRTLQNFKELIKDK